MLAEKAAHEQIRCVSLKLSQGPKSGIGGVLPGAQVNAAIAHVRGVPQGRMVISPPFHQGFSTPRELVAFVAEMRGLSGLIAPSSSSTVRAMLLFAPSGAVATSTAPTERVGGQTRSRRSLVRPSRGG